MEGPYYDTILFQTMASKSFQVDAVISETDAEPRCRKVVVSATYALSLAALESGLRH